MNDDYLWSLLNTYQQARRMDSSLTSQQIYDRLIDLELYNRKDTDMAYSYSRGYYNDTRGDEVATAVLEAYSRGIDFNTLLTKNKQVRMYWDQIQHEKIRQTQARERELERQRKLKEKRAAEQAKREEVMQKLTPEELAAFGLKKGKK